MALHPDQEPAARIDIHLLQTFHRVARLGSFSSAARELGISYQSAANHVRRLEQRLGTRLVETEKGSRQVALTPQGKALNASLGSELESILARLSILMRDMQSVMRVGVPQALFHHFFPGIIKALREHSPEMELAFFERDTALEPMMLSGDLDACISERFFGQATISQVLLGEYNLSLVYPSAWDTDSSHGKPPRLGDFAERPFITYEPGQTIRARAVDHLAATFGAMPRITTTVSGSTSVRVLVEDGLGYAVLPSWMVSASDPRVSQIVLDQIMSVKVYFGCSAFLQGNETIKTLLEICRRELALEAAEA